MQQKYAGVTNYAVPTHKQKYTHQSICAADRIAAPQHPNATNEGSAC